MKKKDYTRLRFGHILGIVDANGAVHSVFTEHVEHHDEHFPHQTHCRWRWNFNESIYWILPDYKPDLEQQDAIMRHLTKTYGIKFWDNGHHDIDDLLKKMGRDGQRDGWN